MRLGVTLHVMAISFWLGCNQLIGGAPIGVVSPDGRVSIEALLRKTKTVDGVPHYRITYDGREVVTPSRLGFDLDSGTFLGGPCEVDSVDRREVRDEFTQITGKRRAVRVAATELVVTLREKAAPSRKWEFIMRAANDGAAFRYRVPQQEGWNSLVIQRERTEFRLSGGDRTFALPLNGYVSSYEKRYQTKLAKDLPKSWLLGLPLLAECLDGTWVAITEANVTEYAGMYLAPSGDGLLSTRLSPLPKEPNVAVRHALPHASPWRVILVGDRIGRLVESDFILSLSEPCAITETSWIKAGKTTFPWWNGYYQEQVAFKMGLNTATAKHYIDFCAEAGIPYHSLDGVADTAWYGGPIVPYKGADITTAIDGLDLPEVLQYAKSKGIRIRLWMHWKAAHAHMENAFPLYRQWGIEGVMLDFMDRDDQEMNRFVREAVALAAANKLTVSLHGCPKPTGLERTYPNLLTHEAVMNLEYDKWDNVGITPDHEVTVPFTRMLAGPLDFHQGSFRTVDSPAFRPRYAAPLVIGTPTRTLASYVVFQNHLPMVADYPTAYRGHPALPVLAAIPTTWDDTRVLDAKVGEYVVMARRSGEEWHIGAMTDSTPRNIAVPLTFLPRGQFQAEIWGDDETAKHGILRREAQLTSADPLPLQLKPAGGAYIRLEPR